MEKVISEIIMYNENVQRKGVYMILPEISVVGMMENYLKYRAEIR